MECSSAPNKNVVKTLWNGGSVRVLRFSYTFDVEWLQQQQFLILACSQIRRGTEGRDFSCVSVSLLVCLFAFAVCFPDFMSFTLSCSLSFYFSLFCLCFCPTHLSCSCMFAVTIEQAKVVHPYVRIRAFSCYRDMLQLNFDCEKGPSVSSLPMASLASQ